MTTITLITTTIHIMLIMFITITVILIMIIMMIIMTTTYHTHNTNHIHPISNHRKSSISLRNCTCPRTPNPRVWKTIQYLNAKNMAITYLLPQAFFGEE